MRKQLFAVAMAVALAAGTTTGAMAFGHGGAAAFTAVAVVFTAAASEDSVAVGSADFMAVALVASPAAMRPCMVAILQGFEASTVGVTAVGAGGVSSAAMAAGATAVPTTMMTAMASASDCWVSALGWLPVTAIVHQTTMATATAIAGRILLSAGKSDGINDLAGLPSQEQPFCVLIVRIIISRTETLAGVHRQLPPPPVREALEDAYKSASCVSH